MKSVRVSQRSDKGVWLQGTAIPDNVAYSARRSSRTTAYFYRTVYASPRLGIQFVEDRQFVNRDQQRKGHKCRFIWEQYLC